MRRLTNCSGASMAFSPDSQLLAVGTFPPAVHLVDMKTFHVLASLKGHHTMVTAVAFSQDGRTLASGAQDRTVRFYNVATGRQVGHIQMAGTISWIAFSPDQQLLTVDEIGGEPRAVRCHFFDAQRPDAPFPPRIPNVPALGSVWLVP